MASAATLAPPSAAPPVLRIRPPPAWTPEEDARLERLAREHGSRHWRRVAPQLPGWSPGQCRGRWRHHLARDVYHRPFTARDDDDLARLYVRHQGRWRDMSRAAHGRTSRALRRRWRELRDTDAFLGKLWRRPPRPAPAPDDRDQDAPGDVEPPSSLQPFAFGSTSTVVVASCDVDTSLAARFACVCVGTAC
ncbi:unnamed protein product [Urochloa humidicola]